jgi:glyoxylase-like metal-dependent hydrolase (beta-lactamase superfamily II)
MTPESAGVLPTSDQQYRASTGGETPGFEMIRDGIGAVAVPVGLGNVPYTLCYLIEDGGGSLHIVDPGDDLDPGWDSLVAALRLMGKSVSDVASITVTHFHPDHLAMAGRLRSASGAPIAMHRLDRDGLRIAGTGAGAGRHGLGERLREWGVPREARDVLPRFTGPPRWADLEPDRLLEDGDHIDAPGRKLLIRHTPGHTAGHVCVQLDDERLLLSGDHVVPTVVPGIGLSAGADSGEAISGYLDSLDAVGALDGYEVLPGHGYRFLGLAKRAGFIREHHLARTREVIDALGRAPGASVWETASQLTWSAGWDGLRPPFRFSALAQTQMHMQFVRSGRAATYLAPTG